MTNLNWRTNLHNWVKQVLGNLPGVVVDVIDAAYLEGLEQDKEKEINLAEKYAEDKGFKLAAIIDERQRLYKLVEGKKVMSYNGDGDITDKEAYYFAKGFDTALSHVLELLKKEQ